MRSRYPAPPSPERWSGLAVPTLVAAVACGGSVFAIAATGAVALERPELPTVTLPAGAAAEDPGARGGPAAPSTVDVTSLGSAIPPAGTRRHRTRSHHRPHPAAPTRAVIAAGAVPTPAATGVVHSIAVEGGGFDGRPVPPADRGPLTAPRVVAAADPTVVVLDPTPTASGTPSSVPSDLPPATPSATTSATPSDLPPATGSATPSGTPAPPDPAGAPEESTDATTEEPTPSP